MTFKLKLLFPLFLMITFNIHGIENNTSSKGFVPWYTGPLIAPSASNMLPGTVNIQPYVYVTDIHSVFDSNHKHQSTPDTITTNITTDFQFGLNSFLDVTINLSGYYNHRKSKNVLEYGDTPIAFGFQIIRQEKGTFIPSIRVKLKETFPTGRYQKLNPDNHGIDSSGTGAYSTTFVLVFAKTLYYFETHPIAFRLGFNYTIPSTVHVLDFHAYGGGYNTDGKVRPPNTFATFFSFEFSFTQRWVYAMDFTYSHQTASHFNGIEGTNADGTIAHNTVPASTLWTIAPAIEYNFSQNFGMIAGVWIAIDGSNAQDFTSYVYSFTYSF